MAAEIEKLLAKVPTGLFINGRWRAGAGAEIEVENPATAEVLAHVQGANREDALAALEAAVEAQKDWARTAPRDRAETLRRAFELVMEHREELATLITLEMGKPIAEARGEVTYGAEYLRWFSEEASRIYGHSYISPEGKLRVSTVRRPVGPCLLITPWNFPLAMATRKVAPAIAAGCTMVLKPAESTPLTALYFAELMNKSGLPSGVLNVIPAAQPADVSEPLLADRRLRKLSFTGSTAVGRALLKLSADNVLQTSMELGGNAPFLVFEDADLEAAAHGAEQAKMRNIGEACTAANRFLVHGSVAEDFARLLAERFAALKIGNGLDETVRVGPLINAAAVEKVSVLVDDALSHGAQRILGGASPAREGYFYEPTVLSGVSPDARLFKEEIFGPVAPILTFEDEEEAWQLANDTEYGLAAYVYTQDIARLQRAGERLEFGVIGLNAGVVSNAAIPFGGMKASGLGREGGPEGIEEYTTVQYIGMRNLG